jgi:crotonobetaine/carnitine-CoA ligase
VIDPLDPADGTALATRSLVGAYEDRAAREPDTPFARFDDRPPLTMGETMDAVRGFAGALRERGIAAGDGVLLALDNSPEFLVGMLGTWYAGARMVPLVPEAGERLYRRALELVQPRLALAGPAGAARLAAVGAHEVLELVEVDDAAPGPLAAELRPLVSGPQATGNRATGLGEAAVMFTSGTTGPPKGVCLSHLWYVWASRDLVAGMSYDAADVLYTCLPLGHANAQDTTLGPALISGARVAFDRRFSAGAFWRRVRDAGATAFNLIGNMPRVLLNRAGPEGTRDHTVTRGFAIPALAHYRRAFAERFGVELLQGYGSTEIGVPVFQDQAAVQRGSCGLPVAGTRLRIMRPDGTPAAIGEVGEICAWSARPGAITHGYLREPERTVQAWRAGWFHTGDLGRLDADGHLFFAGRLGDALRRKGENLSAHDIESVLLEMDSVAECAVIGRKADDGDDEIVAYVVVAEGRTLDPGEVAARCTSALGRAAAPAEVLEVEALPRTESGKVAKGTLRAEAVRA